MNFINLPKDIIIYIKSFLSSTCENCNEIFYFFDFNVNVSLKKYVSVFDDFFYIKTYDDTKLYKFNILCNKCFVHFYNQNFFRVIK